MGRDGWSYVCASKAGSDGALSDVGVDLGWGRDRLGGLLGLHGYSPAGAAAVAWVIRRVPGLEKGDDESGGGRGHWKCEV